MNDRIAYAKRLEVGIAEMEAAKRNALLTGNRLLRQDSDLPF